MTNKYHRMPRITATLITTMLACSPPPCHWPHAALAHQTRRIRPRNHRTQHPKKRTPTKSKTKTITYDKFFIKYYFSGKDGDSPEKTAQILKEQHDDYTDAYATPDGDVIATATEKQLKNNINEGLKERKEFEQTFNKDAKEKHNGYRFQISKDGKTFSLWCDNQVNDKEYLTTLGSIPKINGDLYYLNGGSGPWDMQINLYDCHTSQPTRQYLWSQDPNGEANGWHNL